MRCALGWMSAIFSLALWSYEARAQSVISVLPSEQRAFISFSTERKLAQSVALMKQSAENLISGRQQKQLPEWESFCQSLGKSLVSTATKPGFLKSFACLGGEAKPSEIVGNFWHIEFLELKRTMELRVYYSQGETSHLVQLLSFRLQGDARSVLAKPDAGPIFARILHEKLPTGWAYVHKPSGETPNFALSKLFSPITDDLFIYDLFFSADEGVWLPRIRAVVSPTKGKDLPRPGQLFLPLREGNSYWIQSASESGRAFTEYDSVITDKIGGISILSDRDRKFIERMEAHSVATLFSPPLIKRQSVTSKASHIQVRLDLNRGPFDGLRLQYESVPRVTQLRNERQESLHYNRSSPGWSFKWETPYAMQPYLTQLVLLPKVELMSFGLQSQLENSSGLQTELAFLEDLILFPSISLGLETVRDRTRHRIYGVISSPELQVFNQTSAISTRKISYEFHHTSFDIGDTASLGFLLTSSIENVALRKSVDDKRTVQGLLPSELKFSLIFLGGGVALEW